MQVLILVLVEHTLRGCQQGCRSQGWYVLILVLVEHTLRVAAFQTVATQRVGLNPCFSGTYSQRDQRTG